MKQRIFSAAKKGSTLEMLVYDMIGATWYADGVTAAGMKKQMKDAGEYDAISLRINSPGGNAFEGVAIYNLLRAEGKPVSVFVDGVAASAASIIAMAGDTISMGQGSMMMIHNASTFAGGDANEFRKVADTLDKVCSSMADLYASRTGKAADQIKTLMDAETWMSAEDCVKEGFATDVVTRSADEQKQAKALAASFNLSAQFTKAPVFEETQQEETQQEQEILSVDWEGQLAVRRRHLELIGK
jgi:ATP-dependent protease ClpP protease subunit